MATSTSVCTVCDLRHRTSPTTDWCMECEESLCSDCREHHNIQKATKSHKTIPITEYQLLPTVVTDISQDCIYHNERYQLYCMKHENPICNKCVKDHGRCGEILSLKEVVNDIKTSESFVDLEQSLEDLFDNIIKIRKKKESNITSIKDQQTKITAHICDFIKEVIQHVEKLGEAFIKELDQHEFNCTNTIRSSVSSLQNKEKEIHQMKSYIQNTKKYASDLQTFLSMRELQAKTTEYEKNFQSSIENENDEIINIEIEINSKIQDILTVDRFGSIKVEKSPSTYSDQKRRKDRQAQIQVINPKPIILINDIKLKFKQKLDTTCKNPIGCCVTCKGELVTTKYEKNNSKVIAINAEGEVEYTIPLKESYTVFDLVCLNDSKVAVSSGYSNTMGIIIVDLTKRKVVKFIDLHECIHGIAYDGKSLICCVLGHDFHVISCTDYSVTTIPHTYTTLSWHSYVSTHADKIFSTNPEKQTVNCCLYSGENVWEFQVGRFLDRPQGITVDDNGNIFVVGMDSCSAVVISLDGKQCKQILTKADGLDRPTTICFDKERKQLIVTNQKQFAYIFNISYL